jgi:anthranilate synthase component 1
MNPKMDAQLAKDLKNDPKETSEHMMLVDLSRNDLGKVSEVGSVKISEFKKIKKHASVMHLTSVVSGVKKSEFNPIDVFKAVFPAGTLTGAPKVKAMQLIDEMETCKRGIYGGAIGFINHKDHLDLCIGIRMIILSDNKATVQAGAGIVLDSCPQSEADETRHKVMGLSKLLNNINRVYNNATNRSHCEPTAKQTRVKCVARSPDHL